MRRKNSLRLKNYNYSSPGYYFVTLCINEIVENQNLFGTIDVKNPYKIKLSKYGKIAEKYFKQIPFHYENVIVNEYIIMPDHIHAIIEITYFDNNFIHNGDTKYGKLSKIIKSYKNIVTTEIRKSGFTEFKWKRSFYDHIIRKSEELYPIQKYIILNPFRLFVKCCFREK